jgi:hypothetical protein
MSEIKEWMKEAAEEFTAVSIGDKLYPTPKRAQRLAEIIAEHCPGTGKGDADLAAKEMICYACGKPIIAAHGVGTQGPIHWECYDKIFPKSSEVAPEATPTRDEFTQSLTSVMDFISDLASSALIAHEPCPDEDYGDFYSRACTAKNHMMWLIENMAASRSEAAAEKKE